MQIFLCLHVCLVLLYTACDCKLFVLKHLVRQLRNQLGIEIRLKTENIAYILKLVHKYKNAKNNQLPRAKLFFCVFHYLIMDNNISKIIKLENVLLSPHSMYL